MDKYIRSKLKNKINYILVPFKNTYTSTIFITVKVGSCNETPIEYGLAHFVSHMLFKGTEKHKKMENITNFIHKHGGNVTYRNTFESTQFAVTINSNYVDSAIEILHDMLFHSTFNETEIQSEKGVIINEIKKNISSAETTSAFLNMTSVFKNTCFEHSITADEKNVKSFNKKQVTNFHKKWYTPDRITIVIAGNYTKPSLNISMNKHTENIIKILNKTFGSVKLPARVNNTGTTTKLDNITVPLSFQTKTRYIKRYHNNHLAYITIGFPSYSINHKYAIHTDILESILSRKIFNKLRGNGLVHRVFVRDDRYSDKGIFQISFATNNDDKSIKNCIKYVFNSINSLKNRKVTTKELDLHKNYTIGNFKINLESTFFVSEFYSKNFVFTDKKTKNIINNYITTCKKCSKDDILYMSNEIFNIDRCTINIHASI